MDRTNRKPSKWWFIACCSGLAIAIYLGQYFPYHRPYPGGPSITFSAMLIGGLSGLIAAVAAPNAWRWLYNAVIYRYKHKG